jgi:hypothetical protein
VVGAPREQIALGLRVEDLRDPTSLWRVDLANRSRQKTRKLASTFVGERSNTHPEAGKCLYRLAIDNKFERLRAANRERRQLLLAPSVLAPPPKDMDAIIDSIVPRQWEDELRKEVCQELAIEVLERRCECTPAALKSILIAHRNHYHRKYANRWGDASLDEQLFENSELVMGGAVTHHPRGLTQRPVAPKRPSGAEF